MRKSIALLPGIAGLALAAIGMGPGVDIMKQASPVPPLPGPKRSKRRNKVSASVVTSNFDPRINRHTGKAHEHRREIARRTTRPGTPERASAYVGA